MAVVTEVHHEQARFPLSLDTRPPSPITREFPPTASIVLIGSRGAGKRTLGFVGATHFGRRLITEDWYFQAVTGLSKAGYLQQYGDQDFYRRNIEVLREMLEGNRSGCIIECGMGSLSTQGQQALREYSKTNPVIYVTRDSREIRNLLRLGDEEARRLEQADLAHRNCSNLEYYNLHDPSCDGTETPPENGIGNVSSRLKYAKQDFCAYLDTITGQGLIRSRFESPFSIAALPPECRSHTYALSLRLSIIPDLDLEELEAGADLVQLKIDSWIPDIQKVIGEQIATIRRKLGVPIIFHVEDYVFGDTSMTMVEKEHHYFNFLEHGLRFGVEYLVIDLKYSADGVRRLVKLSGRTKVIGQYLSREESNSSWNDAARMVEYANAKALGVDIIRFVRASSDPGDNDAVRMFLNRIDAIPNHLPVIAYNLGNHGRPSLVANKIFTPVTHPIMQNTVSKSQLRQYLITAREAMEDLYQSNLLDPLHFMILGGSVFYSLSPAMHTAAYQVCGLSHDFRSTGVSSLEDIYRLAQDPHFGGAAITQPFKVQILSRIVAKSYHAKAIGAVNTLLPLRRLSNGNLDGTTASLLRQANNRSKAGPICAYYGDNTDFIGIMTCLRRNISPRNVVQPSTTTGLVIGAGGMARAAIYAMIQMGCRKIFIYNRTLENALAVASHFNSWASGLSSTGEIVHVLPSLTEDWPPGYKQPTMIVSCVPARAIGDQKPANFKMPLQWLRSPTGGVVAELAYLPLDTPLLQQIRRVREETKQPWVIVDGLELLPEQAIAQFEMMTGRKAPKRRMRMEVWKNYHRYRES